MKIVETCFKMCKDTTIADVSLIVNMFLGILTQATTYDGVKMEEPFWCFEWASLDEMPIDVMGKTNKQAWVITGEWSYIGM